MKLQVQPYQQQLADWPSEGRHIMAQYTQDKIVVYQSYRPAIGLYAAENQFFGGPFSLNRMTWIKPNFLWMMFRNGWGTKEGQEVVLAIHLKMSAFLNYLENAVQSTFNSQLHGTRENWQELVKQSHVRLQWDPDHDPYGNKVDRKAIQIGLREAFIRSYSKEDILAIEDISAFVKTQYEFVKNGRLDQLETPLEQPLIIQNEQLRSRLRLD